MTFKAFVLASFSKKWIRLGGISMMYCLIVLILSLITSLLDVSIPGTLEKTVIALFFIAITYTLIWTIVYRRMMPMIGTLEISAELIKVVRKDNLEINQPITDQLQIEIAYNSHKGNNSSLNGKGNWLIWIRDKEVFAFQFFLRSERHKKSLIQILKILHEGPATVRESFKGEESYLLKPKR
ncbi:MAG: hypothetical protein HC880_03315 [Bacteroidia bacterium]|nr:hypothetical protein [Bacteroidia bacterium]